MRRFAILCLAIAVTAALGAAPACAETTRLYTGTSFGPDGVGGTTAFEIPQAVTVDPATGDIYVLDAGEGGRLYKFDDTGQPSNYASLSGNVIEGVGGSVFGAENEIAIAPPGSPGGTAGDIYLANNNVEPGALQVYGADGAKLGELVTGGETCGVAVDPSGHLFIGVFPFKVIEYVPTTNPPTSADEVEASTAELPFICNVAADGLGNIYASNFFGGSTAKLEGLADATPTLIEPGGAALAVDPATDDLYLDEGSSIAVYSSTGEPKEHFGSGLSESHGVAVGAAAETIYVTNRGTGKVDLYGSSLILPDVTTEPATGIGPESATLNGTISAAGGPEASCEFQLTTEKAFKAEGFTGATSVPCEPSSVTGTGVEAVSGTVSDLAPGTDYRFRVLGANVDGSNVGQALSFVTLGPTVVSSTVTDIATTGATLTGFVDPRGKAFTYHFDFGPTQSYGTSVPVPDLSGDDLPVGTGDLGFKDVRKIENVVMSQGAFTVGQDIVGVGIEPGTTITAIEGSTLILSRPLAAPGSGVSLTSTTVFVSQLISGLAPGADYHARLVATNADATYLGPDRSFSTYPVDTGLPDGRAYEMVSPPQKIGEVFAPESLGTLAGTCRLEFCLPGGNGTTAPMQATADGETLAYEGQPFTAGLSPAGNQYLGKRSSAGWATSAITPAAAPGSTIASGFKAFSADLSRGVLFQTSPALSPEAPGEGAESFSNLYRWEAGSPTLRPLVTVEPPSRDPGERIVEGTNAFDLYFSGGNSGGGGVEAFEHLVFEANDALTAAVPTIAPAAPEVGAGRCGGSPAANGLPESDCNLYEWVGGRLRLVNVLPGNAVAATNAAIGSGTRLAGAIPDNQAASVDHAISADGSRIFWSDSSGQVYVRIDGKETVKVEDPGQFLTATPDGSRVLLSDGCLYSLEAGECEATLAGTPQGFLGIMGASEDLSRIYFLSTEALAEGAEARSCKRTETQAEGEGKVLAGIGCNLYAYDDGAVSFVAALNQPDNEFGLNANYGSWKASRSNRTARVTPDGRYLAFMSFGRLTGFDNRVSGVGLCGARQACFEVFEYDLEKGSLHCASCNPSGQRPLGTSALSLIRVAAAGSFQQPENLPGDGKGRLFFESDDVLSPADTNGRILDVYEWTPPGVGSCERAAGCVALISSGHSSNDSMFLNSTPSGNDAFFITREQLLTKDKDDLLDVYDARVGGGFAEVVTAPCGGEACKGPGSSAPPEQSPGTSTFSGPPNKRHHHKCNKKKHHRKCHKKRHHHPKHKNHHKRSAEHKKTGGSK